MSQDLGWFTVVSQDLGWFTVVSQDLGWFTVVSQDLGWFTVVSQDLGWFTVVSQDLGWFTVVSQDLGWCTEHCEPGFGLVYFELSPCMHMQTAPMHDGLMCLYQIKFLTRNLLVNNVVTTLGKLYARPVGNCSKP